jgi:hypothetical protein
MDNPPVSLITVNHYPQDISGWDVSKVVSASGMFWAAKAFDQVRECVPNNQRKNAMDFPSPNTSLLLIAYWELEHL